MMSADEFPKAMGIWTATVKPDLRKHFRRGMSREVQKLNGKEWGIVSLPGGPREYDALRLLYCICENWGLWEETESGDSSL
jgi:putative hemolysin